MTKQDIKLLAVLGIAAGSAVLVIGSLHCSLMTDFDRELIIPDGGSGICSDDEDCYSLGGRYLCHVCNADTHMCEGSGEDGDRDEWWVCERAIEAGLEDCDDDENTVHPDGDEVTDLMDNDCNGIIDDGMLEADGSAPALIEKSSVGCSGCTWSRPDAAWDGTNVTLVWESDEDTNEKMLRVAKLDRSGGIVSAANDYVIWSAGVTTYNLTNPSITHTGEPESAPLGAAWIDHLGGEHVSFLAIDASTASAEPRWTTETDVEGDDPLVPVVASRLDRHALVVAWIGIAPGETQADLFLVRFEYAAGWTPDVSVTADGLINVSGTPGEHEAGAPALVVADEGAVLAWVAPDTGDIKVASWDRMGEEVDVLPVPGTGLSGGFRDPVLVRSDAEPGLSLVYLLFCARPEGGTGTEVYAVSVDLEAFGGGVPEDVFGAPLRLSQSPNDPSMEVAGYWTGDESGAIGVVWNDRRGSRRHIYFRRIADLEVSMETSGVLASDELNLSVDDGDPEGPGVYGQGPTIVSMGENYMFGVVWWQNRDSGGEPTGDLYYRTVDRVME